MTSWAGLDALDLGAVQGMAERKPRDMRPVIVVHGVVDASRPDEQDTLDQVREVSEALQRLGHAAQPRALSLDLSALSRIARRAIVFNLVEAIDGNGRLQHLAPAVMEHLGLTFTGCPASAIATTTDKVLTKRLLAARGLPVPETVEAGAEARAGDRYIVKSLTEDASFGIDAGSVVFGDKVAAELTLRRARFGGNWFAERYVEGREFNISVIEDGDGLPKVLPAAEIQFVGYADERPRIVDYEAKWIAGSHGYDNTPRRFVSAAVEPALVAELERLTLGAWNALGLSGYARIDFRVDAAGRCYILEANANPCLTRDAGFAAAVTEAGLDYDDAIRLIVAAAERRAPR